MKSTEKRPVAAGRRSNAAYRVREHLTEDEMARLLAALKRKRHGQRDWLIGLLIYRHGLRVSEACDLRWDDIDLPKRTIETHFARCKDNRSPLCRSLCYAHLPPDKEWSSDDFKDDKADKRCRRHSDEHQGDQSTDAAAKDHEPDGAKQDGLSVDSRNEPKNGDSQPDPYAGKETQICYRAQEAVQGRQRRISDH
jgi:hypothetical protein